MEIADRLYNPAWPQQSSVLEDWGTRQHLQSEDILRTHPGYLYRKHTYGIHIHHLAKVFPYGLLLPLTVRQERMGPPVTRTILNEGNLQYLMYGGVVGHTGSPRILPTLNGRQSGNYPSIADGSSAIELPHSRLHKDLGF